MGYSNGYWQLNLGHPVYPCYLPFFLTFTLSGQRNQNENFWHHFKFTHGTEVPVVSDFQSGADFFAVVL